MRVVALVSGGKDSCFNMMQCVAAGHEIVALANLYPVGKGIEMVRLVPEYPEWRKSRSTTLSFKRPTDHPVG